MGWLPASVAARPEAPGAPRLYWPGGPVALPRAYWPGLFSSHVHSLAVRVGRRSVPAFVAVRPRAPGAGPTFYLGPFVLHGPCQLRAAVAASVRRGDSESARIFPPESFLRPRFRQYCAEAQLRAGWHAFRRGAASDMLRHGSFVSDILLAGSWRSGAFLRYLRRSDVDTRASLHSAGAGDPGLLEAVFDQPGSDA